MAALGHKQVLAALQARDARGAEAEEWVRVEPLLDEINELNVGNNKLTALPEAIGDLRALETLYARYNALTALPASLCRLQAPKELYVNDNKLTALPEAIGDLRALETLDARDNTLTALPASLCRLQALKVLWVGGNKLTTLPEAIGDLRALETLDARNNALTALPASLCRLQALKELYVNDNKLTALPEAIGDMQALKKLLADRNTLTALPASLCRLQALKELNVNNNPLQQPPLAVANQGIAAIGRYFAQLEHGAAASRKLKLVLIGDGEGGKTSLLRGLQRGGTPDPTAVAERTIQLDLSTLTLGEGADAVLCSAWDFGGQPAYAAAQQPYLAPGALYVLVVPAHRAGDDDGEQIVERHLDALQARAPGAVVLPVLTQADRLVEDVEALRRAEAEFDAAFQAYNEAPEDEKEAKRALARSAMEKRNAVEAKVTPLLAPDALAHAAAPQLAWLRATIQTWQTRHEERRKAMLAEQRQQREHRGGGHGGATPATSVPPTLQLLVDEIPCVCSATGGGKSLAAARQRLESLVLREPPLLPCIGQVLPRDWLAAMALVRALRDGRDAAASVQRALRAVDRAAAASGSSDAAASDDDDPEPAPDPEQRRAYMTLGELRERWASVASGITSGDAAVADVLSDAVQLMCDQGELFTSSDLVFLDPAFATEVLKPLVEHWLSSARAKPEVIEFVKAHRDSSVQKLLGAIDTLTQRGEVREALLPYLWRSLGVLRRDDYDSIIRMLVIGGVLCEERADGVASTAGERSWVMPMRLPIERPAEVDMLFVRDPSEAELCTHRELYDCVLPPGMPERSVAGCQALGQPIESWRLGALIALQKGAKALLEVRPGDAAKHASAWLTVRVRGKALDATLWQAMERLVACIGSILGDFPGLMFGTTLVCPECIRMGLKEPGAWDPDELEGDGEGECERFCRPCGQSVVLRRPNLVPAPMPTAPAPTSAPAPAPASAPAAAWPDAPFLDGFLTGGESAEDRLVKLHNTLSDWDEAQPKTMRLLFHYTSCHVAKLILETDFRAGEVGMAGKGVYLASQSPVEPIDAAAWPSPEFRVGMLKANYDKAWADPGRKLSLDAVLVCFADQSVIEEVPRRPGAWVVLERHVKNKQVLVVRAAIQLYDSTQLTDAPAASAATPPPPSPQPQPPPSPPPSTTASEALLAAEHAAVEAAMAAGEAAARAADAKRRAQDELDALRGGA